MGKYLLLAKITDANYANNIIKFSCPNYKGVNDAGFKYEDDMDIYKFELHFNTGARRETNSYGVTLKQHGLGLYSYPLSNPKNTEPRLEEAIRLYWDYSKGDIYVFLVDIMTAIPHCILEYTGSGTLLRKDTFVMDDLYNRRDGLNGTWEESKWKSIPYNKLEVPPIYELGGGSGSAEGLTTYTSLSQLGLTADATFQDVIDTLPEGGSALLGVKDFTNYQTIFPYEEGNDQFARVHIVKGTADGSSVYARWFRKDGGKEAIANFNINDNTFSGWKMLKNQQVYTALKELGLDTTATINDIVVAMKNGTTFTYKTDVFDYATEYENLRYATVTIIKQTTGRIQIFMTDKNTGNLYIGKMSSDNKVDGWSKVQTEVEVIITEDTLIKYGTEILKYPVGTWRINSVIISKQFTDLPFKDMGAVIEIDSIDPNRSPYEHSYGYRNYIYKGSLDGIIYIRTLNSSDTAGTMSRDTGWRKVCTDDTRVTTLETQVSELFQSVSDGKTLVANAITGKGVSTSTSATFATMATNISKIPQTITWKEETVSASPDSNTHIARFVFSNTVLGVKQMIAPGYHYTAKVVETKMFTINSNTVEVYLDSGTWKMTAMVRNT